MNFKTGFDKKFKILSVTFLVSLFLLVGCVGQPPSPTPTPSPTATASPSPTVPAIKEVKIGLIEPLTGTHAVFGTEAKQAAELIVEDINAKGGIKSLGGAKIKLVVGDTKSDNEGAKLAAEQLISSEHPVVILGAYISRHTAAMAEVTEREKVILVGDALVDFLTEKGYKYFFRVCPKSSAHGKTAMEFAYETAKENGVELKNISVINEDSVFGKYTSEGAIHQAYTYGVTVLDHIEYPYDISDASPIVSKLKSENPQVVVSVPYFDDGVLIAKTMREMGWHPLLVAGSGACGYCDPGSIEAAGAAVEGFTQTYSYNPMLNTPYNKWFVNEFKKRYGKMPTEAGGIIAYSLWTVKEALEKAGEINPSDPLNPDVLKQAFLSLDITSGPAAELYPSQHIRFDAHGDNEFAEAVVLQVQNGQPVLVWPRALRTTKPIFPMPSK